MVCPSSSDKLQGGLPASYDRPTLVLACAIMCRDERSHLFTAAQSVENLVTPSMTRFCFTVFYGDLCLMNVEDSYVGVTLLT